MANPESRGNVSVRNRRLPHWEAEGAIYFVTFRLADSLPEAILESWRWEREDIPKTAEMLQRDLTWVEEQRMDELYGEQAQVYLDHGEGACQLRNPAIAGMVRDALLHFDGLRYLLLAMVYHAKSCSCDCMPIGRQQAFGHHTFLEVLYGKGSKPTPSAKTTVLAARIL